MYVWAILVSIYFLMGVVIGLVTVAIVYRSHFLVGALLGGIGSLLTAFLLFQTHSVGSFFNLYLVCGASSCGVALLADIKRLFKA
jgi:hypothetical protein